MSKTVFGINFENETETWYLKFWPILANFGYLKFSVHFHNYLTDKGYKTFYSICRKSHEWKLFSFECFYMENWMTPSLSFYLLCHFFILLTNHKSFLLKLPMPGFEPGISAVESTWSSNCATTTVQFLSRDEFLQCCWWTYKGIVNCIKGSTHIKNLSPHLCCIFISVQTLFISRFETGYSNINVKV